jgi:hypothetical protein
VNRRRVTAGVSALIVVLGVVLLIETAAVGGGTTGYILGVLFILAGAGRFYLSRRSGP